MDFRSARGQACGHQRFKMCEDGAGTCCKQAWAASSRRVLRNALSWHAACAHLWIWSMSSAIESSTPTILNRIQSTCSQEPRPPRFSMRGITSSCSQQARDLPRGMLTSSSSPCMMLFGTGGACQIEFSCRVNRLELTSMTSISKKVTGCEPLPRGRAPF